MKKLLALLLFALPANASEMQHRNTYCNGYYNSAVLRWDSVKCDAWFKDKKLVRIRFRLPQSQKTYDWHLGSPTISPDKRWRECVRYTSNEGNQWQFCTAKTPEQLNIK